MREERDFTEAEKSLVEFGKMISCGVVSYNIKGSDEESCVIVGTGEAIYYHLSKLVYLVSRENEISPYELLVKLLIRVAKFEEIDKRKPHLFENIKTELVKE